MRVTQRMLVDNLRLNIGNNAANLADLQTQLASGKRLQRPSDDPQALNRALSAKASIAKNDQYLRNISNSRTWLEATDSQLTHISSILTRAHDLALRGSNDTLGSSERSRLSEQVDGLLDEALQTVNASHEGKYIFAGQSTDTQPYAVTTVAGVTTVTYAGDSEDMTREIDQGVELGVNVPGDASGGGAGSALKLMLSTLASLRDHLSSDPSGIGADTGNIADAIDRTSNLRGFVGAKMSRLDATESALKEMQTDLDVSLSRAQDADVAEVLTKLMMQQTVYQAALAAGARVIQPSLLDFLK